MTTTRAVQPIIDRSILDQPKDIKLGEGRHHDVYKVTWQGELVALKVMRSSSMSTMYTKHHSGKPIIYQKYSVDADCQRAVVAELLAHPHPNVHRQIGYGSTKPFGKEGKPQLTFFFWVSEYMPAGDLHDRLEMWPKESWDVRIKMMAGFAAGVAHLHRYRITHGDLKPHNVLLDEDNNCLVTDFDFSRRSDHPSCCFGSPVWMAPELLLGITTATTLMSDVYSAACVLSQISAWNEEIFDHAQSKGHLQFLRLACETPELATDTPPKIAHAITLGFATLPEKRVTMQQIHNEIDAEHQHRSATHTPSSAKS